MTKGALQSREMTPMPPCAGGPGAEIDALRKRMRRLGLGHDEIAGELTRRYQTRPRSAYRLAFGWSLPEAAALLEAGLADGRQCPRERETIAGSRLGAYEQWPYGGHEPPARHLLAMAEVYHTDVLRLLDLADHENLAAADRLILLRTAGRPASDGTSPFGAEVGHLLAARGWSLRELARRVPCDAGHLSRLIRGQKNPSRTLAARLAEVLGPDVFPPARALRATTPPGSLTARADPLDDLG
ncbi:MAG TPA: helix-turn-helix transcriptional regulator [Streptosporangiaceae bacterium]|nr:helix-turn-helix transcriptional regulator [Streptosporangiaceae bacterium]